MVMAEVETTPAPVSEVEMDTKVESEKEAGQKRANGDAANHGDEEPSSKKTKPNPKSDEPPTELEKKIIRQLEYYFGDINLCRDKFMQEKIAEDNGWITMETLLTFKRLASLSKDAKVITDALAKSETQLVQVSDDGLKLRRAPELPVPEINEERRKELTSRSAYVKGIPLDKTLDEILAYFDSQENLENVIRRCYLDKATKKFLFKGSVFITFKTIEACKKYLNAGPYKFDGVGPELILKWQADYFDDKKRERIELKEEQNKQKRANKEANVKGTKIPDCSIIHMAGFSEETTWVDIKTKLTEMEAEVAFVDYSKGKPEAFVRLQGEDSGAAVISKMTDGKVEIGGASITARLLEGEELEKHKEKIKEDMFEMRNKKHQHGRKNYGNKNKGGKKRKGGSRN